MARRRCFLKDARSTGAGRWVAGGLIGSRWKLAARWARVRVSGLGAQVGVWIPALRTLSLPSVALPPLAAPSPLFLFVPHPFPTHPYPASPSAHGLCQHTYCVTYTLLTWLLFSCFGSEASLSAFSDNTPHCSCLCFQWVGPSRVASLSVGFSAEGGIVFCQRPLT